MRMSDESRGDLTQHRYFFRKKMSLADRAELFALPGDSELPADREIPVEIVNVSGGGMLLLITRGAKAAELICEGALVDVSLPSPESVLVMRLLARVVRLERPTPDELRFALEFILISPKEADAIVRIVML